MAINNPTEIPGLIGWKSAKDVSSITIDGSNNVTAFNDQAAGNSLTTIFGTPKSGTRTHNGHNVIDLDGASALGNWGAVEDLQPSAVMYAVIPDDLTAVQEFISSARSNDLGAGVNAAGNWTVRLGSPRDTGVAADTNFHVLIVNFNGLSTNLYVDGIDLGLSLGFSSTDRWRDLLIGARSNSSSSPIASVSENANMAFCESASYSNTLTPTQVADLTAYTAANWAPANTNPVVTLVDPTQNSDIVDLARPLIPGNLLRWNDEVNIVIDQSADVFIITSEASVTFEVEVFRDGVWEAPVQYTAVATPPACITINNVTVIA